MRNGEGPKTSANKLRACLNCSLVQTTEEFKKFGCPNCPFLCVERDRNVNFTTSASFKGTIALIDPKSSWIGKWQRLGNYKSGIYAMVVYGELGEDFIDLVERDGRVYINRNNPFELN